MMREYSVISKGTLPRGEADNFVSVAQYLIVAKKGKKFLLLKLSNDRDEAVTGVKISVRQRDGTGEELGSRLADARVKNGKPHTQFVLTERIPLDEACADCAVELLSAEFGAYAYSVKDGALVASYIGKGKREKRRDEEYLQKTGGRKFSVRSRSVKTSLIALAALFILAIAFGLTFWQVQAFKETATGFRQSGIEYEFINLFNREASPVRVTGYKGKSKEVVIPHTIEGHPVVAVAPNAFQNNVRIERVSLSFEGVVGSHAFAGCENLSEVIFGDVSRIDAGAFSHCYKLKEVSAQNLEYIGQSAFEYCWSLSLIRLSGSAKTLEIGRDAFRSCTSLTQVEIDQFIRYPSVGSLFSKSSGVKSLRLKNLGYRTGYYGGPDTITRLFGFIQPFGLESLTIDYMDEIPAWFCSNLDSLRSVEIGTLSSPVIRMGAFWNCGSLTSLSLPDGITEVGEEAFMGVSLASFAGESLQFIGARAFYGCSSLRFLLLGENEAPTNIGDEAFAFCTSLTELRIPDSVSTMGRGILRGCENLATLTLPFLPQGFLGEMFGAEDAGQAGNFVPPSLAEVRVTSDFFVSSYAFSNCYSLVRVSLPPNATHINDHAFFNCYALEALEVGEALREIGAYAFAYCYSLTSVSLPDTLLKVGKNAFLNCYSVEEMQLPFIGASRGEYRFFAYLFGAFTSADASFVPPSLERIVLTRETEIPKFAFFECASLREIVLNEGIEFIRENAFSNCRKLKQLTVPASVKSIENSAFSDCYRLVEICNKSALDIQKGSALEHGGIGDNALNVYGRNGGVPMKRAGVDGYEFAKSGNDWYLVDCTETGDLSLPGKFEGGGEIVGSYKIPRCLFAYEMGIESVEIPAEVVYLGDYAFIDCQNLTSATFAADSPLREILEGTFVGCIRLRETTLPLGVKRLGESSFLNCFALQRFTVGAAVSEIGKRAFYGCYSLYEVYDYSSLYIAKGSEDHGHVAYYALAVLYSPQEEGVREVTVDGKVYKTWGDVWWLTRYVGSAAELTLDAFEYEGKTIGAYSIRQGAFSGCDSLVRVKIGNAVTEIGAYAFQNCANLTEVVFEKDSPITRIEESAFNCCGKLVRAELPSSLESVGAFAFGLCSALNELILPQDLREIGSQAFWGCKSLKRIYNLSALPLSRGSEEYGYVAYYAQEILDTLDEGAKK